MFCQHIKKWALPRCNIKILSGLRLTWIHGVGGLPWEDGDPGILCSASATGMMMMLHPSLGQICGPIINLTRLIHLTHRPVSLNSHNLIIWRSISQFSNFITIFARVVVAVSLVLLWGRIGSHRSKCVLTFLPFKALISNPLKPASTLRSRIWCFNFPPNNALP